MTARRSLGLCFLLAACGQDPATAGEPAGAGGTTGSGGAAHWTGGERAAGGDALPAQLPVLGGNSPTANGGAGGVPAETASGSGGISVESGHESGGSAAPLSAGAGGASALPASGNGGSAPTSVGGSSGGPSRAEIPFDPQHVLEVELTLPAEDWETLRKQTRGYFDIVGEGCLTQPAKDPFTYFSGSVSIDGARLDNVGIRKKGFLGSLSKTKPALKLKFDEYLENQEYAGLTRLTLNNAVSDASYVKQCLGYSLFAAAGIPAPRCSFARVRVNGESLGLYVNVESVDKRFLKRHFTKRSGNLYEGTLSDFRPDWVNTFEKKTNEDDLDRSDLDAVSDALAISDPGLPERVAARVDLPEFLRFWATEYLVMHADGYSRNINNFIIYKDPTQGRFTFIPWGIDAILYQDGPHAWETAAPAGDAWIVGLLARRLFENADYRAKYEETLRELLSTVWREAAINAEIDRMAALIAPYLSASEVLPVAQAQASLRAFVNGRRAAIEAASQTAVDTSQTLREPWCLKSMGSAAIRFETSWGTLGSANPILVGEASIDLSLNQSTPTFAAIGATSGVDDATGSPVVNLYGAISATEVWVISTVLGESADFRSGVSLPLDAVAATASLVRVDLSRGTAVPELVGLLGDGTLELEAASVTPGAPVVGRISGATVFKIPF